LIRSINMGFRGFSIEYYRGGQNRDPPKPYLDEVIVKSGSAPNPIADEQRIDILHLIDLRTEQASATSPQPFAGVDQLDAIYRSTILKLETKFAEQIEAITSWTVRQAEAAEQRKLELIAETQSEREKLRSTHEARETQLKQYAEELVQKRRDLDDRDYMHARRAIRGDLQKLVATREAKFGLTPSTRRMRLPIHLALVLAIVVLCAVNVIFYFQFRELEVKEWQVAFWAFLKQGLSVAALVGAILYYARWMNRWFEEHANAEFLLKQFQLDVDRASWVVETALEWKRVHSAEIPPSLLEGITKNLFAERDRHTEKLNAADDLASALIGSASQLKLKAGDNEISLDRKGIQQLTKTEMK
jgi:uncharacterized membrane protein